uniref:Uncharacterized protein n=1 Tax=Anguilla anguilla TaxID=7936 RepID=A0A0E9PZD5_ANGAN
MSANLACCEILVKLTLPNLCNETR